jgi:isochorismate pyruvate lyase
MSRVPPEQTRSMAEVRAGVDALDRALVALIAERFAYMDAAARIKESRETVRDEARKRQVIANVMREGERLGLDPAVLHDLWDNLIEASIAHEYREWDRLRAELEADGASDGARTRDLRRDRPAL